MLNLIDELQQKFLSWSNFKYNKTNSTNLYPPTKGYLRETCKSPNVNPIYLTSPLVLFRSLGRVAQSVTCLATDAKLTANPGVASSIPGGSHTFVEIDHEIISTVILLPSAESFMKGCCQLQAKVCARITGYPLVQACPGKKCG